MEVKSESSLFNCSADVDQRRRGKRSRAIGLHRQRAPRPLWTLSAVWPEEVTKAAKKAAVDRRGRGGREGRQRKVAWHIKAKKKQKACGKEV